MKVRINPGPTLHGSTIQEIAAERDALRAQLDTVSKERDAFHRDREEWARRCDAAQREMSAAIARAEQAERERDELRRAYQAEHHGLLRDPVNQTIEATRCTWCGEIREER